MKNVWNLIAVTALMLVASGCAIPIKYGYDKTLYHREAPHALTAVVDVAQDLRTQDEHDGTFSTTKDYMYTQDKIFKKEIGMQVSKALVEHLKKAKVFTKVEVKDLSDFKEDPSVYESLSATGADIAIFGDLHHFYGFRSGKSSSMTASMFGLVGVLTEAMANKKVVGGRAMIGDAKVVDIKNQKVLWQGDIDHDFEDKDTFYGEAPGYAIEALKKANDKFVQTIDEALKDR